MTTRGITGNMKITDEQVREAADVLLRTPELTMSEVAARYGVTQETLSRRLRRVRARVFSGCANFNARRRKLTSQQVRDFRNRFYRGEASMAELTEESGLSHSAVWDMLNYVTYKEVRGV